MLSPTSLFVILQATQLALAAPAAIRRAEPGPIERTEANFYERMMGGDAEYTAKSVQMCVRMTLPDTSTGPRSPSVMELIDCPQSHDTATSSCSADSKAATTAKNASASEGHGSAAGKTGGSGPASSGSSAGGSSSQGGSNTGAATSGGQGGAGGAGVFGAGSPSGSTAASNGDHGAGSGPDATSSSDGGHGTGSGSDTTSSSDGGHGTGSGSSSGSGSGSGNDDGTSGISSFGDGDDVASKPLVELKTKIQVLQGAGNPVGKVAGSAGDAAAAMKNAVTGSSSASSAFGAAGAATKNAVTGPNGLTSDVPSSNSVDDIADVDAGATKNPGPTKFNGAGNGAKAAAINTDSAGTGPTKNTPLSTADDDGRKTANQAPSVGDATGSLAQTDAHVAVTKGTV